MSNQSNPETKHLQASIGLFNPTPSFCYIAPGPYGCQTNPNVQCRFADTAPYFYEAFAQVWIQLAVSNFVICIIILIFRLIGQVVIT